MHFDGSKSTIGACVGILFIILEKEITLYSLKLSFSCTHNMVEYKALIEGLKMLLQFNRQRVHIFAYSLLVVSQANRDYKSKIKN